MTKITEVWEETSKTLEELNFNDIALKFQEEFIKYKNSLIQAPVLGSMKAGKSSLLNRLLDLKGEYELPLDVIQTTGKPVYISNQPTFYRSIINKETDDLSLIDYDDWVSFVKGEKDLEKNSFLEMGVESEFLKKTNLKLVDTPGINTPTENYFDITWSTVIDSKLALYVIDSRQIISSSDFEFIKSVKNYAGGFIFILSRFDQIPNLPESWKDKEVQDQVNHLKSKLLDLGIESLAICPVSSKIKDDELSGFLNLRDTIKNIVISKKEEFLAKSVLNKMKKIILGLYNESSSKEKFLTQTKKTDKNLFFKNCSDIEINIAESKDNRKSEERNLLNKIENLKFDTLNSYSSESDILFIKVKENLNKINSLDSLENYSKVDLRSDLDLWRNKVSDIFEKSISKVSDLIDSSSNDWMKNISNSIDKIFEEKIDLSISSIPK